MTTRRAIIGLVVLASLLVPLPAQAAGMYCQVSSPIYAADLNAGGTWYFEVYNATPNVTYQAMVTWAKDPSNGGHANAGIITDGTGYGRTTLGRYWAPDGTVPGYFAFWDPYDPASGFVAEPGAFKVRIYPPHRNESDAQGSANCAGEVL